MSVLLTFRDGAGQSGVLYKYREGEGLERVSSEPVDAFCVNSVRGCVYAFRDQQLLRIRHRAPPYKVDHMWTLSPDWSPPDYMMRGQVRQMAMVQSSMIEDHFKEREETAPPLLAIVRHSSHNHTSDSEVFYLARLEIVDLNRGEVVVSVAWLQTPWCPNLAYVEHTIYFQACGPAIDKVDACLVYDAPFSKCKNMRKFS
ncbi:hypothetical protein Pmar_PMAR002180 [Perkinsus marinus ATCC 50983]|uniref:Uncharacterized protein n=1 Tax=Perkinsus marinus (strain ATCC 50983 / TXsc) TaxID=423536 RepID=C5L8V3_PERM5|nr:hypothetical protein Pmar_PMAR002180 [Perkinsus marinus ATCC 50983]EER06811.1 hypothetical protein Pmar_PMAR002180 [Perkinsus marinus ATCC 50983]|eukprot:XP_002774995.1 hypothetical protein Pmar_PMAR002180 [Perkinsus marinus ATCC 50983]